MAGWIHAQRERDSVAKSGCGGSEQSRTRLFAVLPPVQPAPSLAFLSQVQCCSYGDETVASSMARQAQGTALSRSAALAGRHLRDIAHLVRLRHGPLLCDTGPCPDGADEDGGREGSATEQGPRG